MDRVTLYDVLTQCPDLRELDLCYASGLRLASEEQLASGAPFMYACCASTLRMNGTDGDFRPLSGPLTIQFPRLVALDLGGSSFSSPALQRLLAHCPCIQYLSFWAGRHLDDAALHMIGAHCPGLTHLDLCRCKGISDAGLQKLLAGCPRLRQLDISGCRGLTDACMGQISRFAPDMQDLNVFSHATELGLASLSLPKLASLDISRCKADDESISQLASRAPCVRSCDLSDCALLSNRALQDIAQFWPHLMLLDLSRVHQVTDDGLRFLLAGCPRLASLFLAQTQVSDATLQRVPAALPCLAFLDLSRCARVTQAGVMALQACLSLRYLSLRACERVVRDERLEAFMRRFECVFE